MPLGYILMGGASRRMRRPKALLGWYHQPLFARLTETLRSVCSKVTLLGANRPEFDGYRVLEDRVPGLGPLGGVLTALQDDAVLSSAVDADPWRLIVSCDLALIDERLLRELIQHSESAAGREADLVAPFADDGRVQALCGLWRTNVRERLAAQVSAVCADPGGDRRRLSVLRFAESLKVAGVYPYDHTLLHNINTMRDFLAALGGHRAPDA